MSVIYKKLFLVFLLFSFLPSLLVAKENSVQQDEFSDYLDTAAYQDGVFVNKDEYENYNRRMFGVNEKLDHYFLEPLARNYRRVAGKHIIQGVRNFGENLSQPVVFFNCLFQGRFTDAVHTFWRFTINTTYGIGGLFDISSQFGVPDIDNDFGLTLAYYGYDESNYFMIPLYKPSTIRDTLGFLVDLAMDPFNFLTPTLGLNNSVPLYIKSGVVVISKREQVLDQTDKIYSVSLDKYAAIKSAYLQYRENQVRQFLRQEKQ